MRKQEKTDAQLTAEFCLQEGVFGPELQASYGVIRGGEELWVKREYLTLAERKIIGSALKTLATRQ